ncbi:phospholipase D-like domain-containing protein [Lolliginicoccus suaedae]|uniref:phospholipase D-like domain-containing protein n=1 Tax=Lolliginicoccus suaedae TaxID=2605429 RepID=UPI0011EC2609|nr:phospholipase D-like domain-containing protein [Lolliginicoccus suaedae]
MIARISTAARRLAGRSLEPLAEPSYGFDPRRPWLLTARERDNPQAAVSAWTTGNLVRPLIDGHDYFARLATTLAAARDGDLVLFTDWRGDPEQVLDENGTTIAGALAGAARRGAIVRGLMWRSHPEIMGFTHEKHCELVEEIAGAGGEVVLDHRVLTTGSHHQKFVVIRYGRAEQADVAFVGGIDLARSRRDTSEHSGDPLAREFPPEYGPTPPWHDVQVEIQGPGVADVEMVFRERWNDPAMPSRLPWHSLPDLLHPRLSFEASPLPDQAPPPAPAGSCEIQLLRTYPRRRPAYPFAPRGERSIARGYAKALHRARSLIYIEDQYMWSLDVARVFAHALRENPGLRMIVVVPRFLDEDGSITIPSALLGHAQALQELQDAAADRVAIYDLENHAGTPVYVHAKVCVIDDVWATVGSDNFNRRSWTHDSELTAAIIDEEADGREPIDPGGLGDKARAFARSLRLRLAAEHLDRSPSDIDDLLDPGSFFDTMRKHAQALDAWHVGGRTGERPAGRLRAHSLGGTPRWQRVLAAPVYRTVVDPDGRPSRMRLAREF